MLAPPNSRQPQPTWLLLILVAMPIGATWFQLQCREPDFAAETTGGQRQRPEQPLPVLNQIKPFTLTDQFGAPFTETQLAGQIWVANLMFTHCQGPCPSMSQNLAAVQNAFAPDDKVKLVSISVDPENDTPPVLARYAQRYQARTNQWHFLTGPTQKVKVLAKESFLLGSHEQAQLHSTRFVLIDPRGQVRGYYAGPSQADTKSLIRDIRRLLPE